MDTILFLSFAAVYLGLFVWCVVLIARRGYLIVSDAVALVLVALIYDNLVIGLGSFIGEGAGLESANALRFWLHAFVTPLLVLVAWHVLARAGVAFARTVAAFVIAVALTVALIVYEVVMGAASLDLSPSGEFGVLSYSDASAPAGPPAMVLVVAAALLAAGIGVWVRMRWPWLTVVTVVMVAGSAVPIPVPSGAVTNLFELILLAGIVATIVFQDARVVPRPEVLTAE
ncbi:hypothetical protein [uncultured Microbacterium sp.]|uniref:hypothetical protein n=1 Tax=uncultured Microbacterium sp. TaxID=191216 RepID=UPI002637D015|nr:hypothetical protein [uncultured Microbacterium sp.]